MVISLIASGVGAFHLTAGAAIASALLKRSPRQHDQLPFISIVVPARNEAENLPRLFRSLARLSYEPAKVELIIVNDDSTDNTKKLALELGNQLPFEVRVIDAVHGPDEVLPPTKTLPLAQGIDVANGEFVLMTDGDCELHENWACDIVRHFEAGIGLVCGITLPDYESSSERVTRFEAVDWSLLLGVCAGMCRLGSPLALIGNNYAVRRQCYADIGTFRSIAHNRIDDIALFRAVADSSNWGIAFAVTSGACVRTLPVGGTEAIVKQRYRWMEGFDAVSMTGKMLFGFGMLTHLLWPLTFLLGMPFGLAVAGAILLGDWMVITACLTRLKKFGLFGYVLAYPAYACGYGWGLLVSLFRRPAITWKDRRLA
ncbi:MAG: glycosyltransferase [bacterium]|nr:glycosyltransferase [bacterium]